MAGEIQARKAGGGLMVGELAARGAGRMGIQLPRGAAQKYEQFYALLAEANARLNLTRVPMDPREFTDRHVLDSISPLAIAELFDGVKTIIDVGAGAGFPGIPISIALPETMITLLDSKQKKIHFMREAITRLELNAEAVCARAEEASRYKPMRGAFDIAVSRAVASLKTLLEWVMPFVKPGGAFVVYKGPALERELIEAADALRSRSLRVRGEYRAAIPGRAWDHRLLVIEKLRLL
jgi:16S rRNA (guanine527-N7)-methyltransferase